MATNTMTTNTRTIRPCQGKRQWRWIIFVATISFAVDPVVGKVAGSFRLETAGKDSRRGERRRAQDPGQKEKVTKSPSFKETKSPSFKETKAPNFKETKSPSAGKGKQPTTSPTTSFVPTYLPTESLQPSSTFQPSFVPSQTPRPSIPPTSAPSTSPTRVPTDAPSNGPTAPPPTGSPTNPPPTESPTNPPPTGSPTNPPPTESPTNPPPTESPTVSSPPTGSASPTSPLVTITQTSTGVEYTCETTTPPPGYSAVQFQLFEFQVDLCIDTIQTDVGVLESTSEAILEKEIAPGLAALHVDCEPGDKYEFLGVIFDNTRKGTLVDKGSTGSSERCYELRDAGMQLNFAERIPTRRINLATSLSNRELAELFFFSINALYDGIVFPNPDYPGVLSANVTGLSNYETDSISDSDQDEQQTNSLVSDSNNGGSDGSPPWIPALFAVCSVLLVVLVAVIIVKKRYKHRETDVSHVMLKDIDDDDYLAGTPYGKKAMGSGAILKDLDPDEDFGEDTTEDDSLEVSQVDYPQVYVMGDGDDSVADEDEDVRYTAGAYWAGGQPEAPGPTFVTTDLKKAMRDLEPPAPTPQKARGYIHSDTVDL